MDAPHIIPDHEVIDSIGNNGYDSVSNDDPIAKKNKECKDE